MKTKWDWEDKMGWNGTGYDGVEPVEQWLIETFENTNKTTMWRMGRHHPWPTLHGGISNAVPAIIFAFFCLATADLNVNIRVNNTGVPCILPLQSYHLHPRPTARSKIILVYALYHYTVKPITGSVSNLHFIRNFNT